MDDDIKTLLHFVDAAALRYTLRSAFKQHENIYCNSSGFCVVGSLLRNQLLVWLNYNKEPIVEKMPSPGFAKSQLEIPYCDEHGEPISEEDVEAAYRGIDKLMMMNDTGQLETNAAVWSALGLVKQ
jgi:hypothetical protein